MLVVRAVAEADVPWATSLISSAFGSTRMVSRGRLHNVLSLPGLVAEFDGVPAGLAAYRIDGDDCELVTLICAIERQGAGTALIRAVTEAARAHGCRRLWLITTNDNTYALRFYQRRGFRLAAFHAGAIAVSRGLKPEIPDLGDDGIPIRDEIELDLQLD